MRTIIQEAMAIALLDASLLLFSTKLTDMGVKLAITLPFLYQSTKFSGFVFSDSCTIAVI